MKYSNSKNIGSALILGTAMALGSASTLAAGPMEETRVTEQSTAIGAPVVEQARGKATRAVTVSYADLRLESQAGINTLYTRIEGAAQAVCGPNATKNGRDLNRHREWQGCLSDAMDGAVADINHYGLSQYHLAQTGRLVGSDEQVAER